MNFGCGGPIRTEWTITLDQISQRTYPFRRVRIGSKTTLGAVLSLAEDSRASSPDEHEDLRCGQLRLHGLSERDPESVDVTNDELTHAVEGIVKVFHDLNSVLEASVEVVDVVGRYVQVDLATVVRAGFPTCVEH